MTIYRSGQSIFSGPKPIDLGAARRAGYSLDIDIEAEERAELGEPLIRDSVVFDAEQTSFSAMPRAAEAVRERDVEDLWAELG
jgi:hypothetical protein